MLKKGGGGGALASVELGGGVEAVQVCGNLGLAVIPVYLPTVDRV
jgi:hypothetical protein